MKQFEFADFVDEFSVSFTVHEQQTGGYGANGKWIPGGEASRQIQGIILPLTDDDLRYVTNGAYTERDRKLYTKEPLVVGSKMTYNGQLYTIQQFKDYTAYADVYIYVAKGAG